MAVVSLVGQAHKVPVTERAVVQRLNRALRPQEMVLKACRSGQWHAELGDWYLVNFRYNAVYRKHVDLEAMAREEGVLKDWEEVAE